MADEQPEDVSLERYCGCRALFHAARDYQTSSITFCPTHAEDGDAQRTIWAEADLQLAATLHQRKQPKKQVT